MFYEDGKIIGESEFIMNYMSLFQMSIIIWSLSQSGFLIFLDQGVEVPTNSGCSNVTCVKPNI